MKKEIKKTTKKIVAFGLATAMAFSVSPMIKSDAAAKKPKLNKKTLYLTEGDTYTLKVKPNGVKIKSTKWSTTNKKVVKVSKKGKVTAKKGGSATIKAVVTAKNKKKYTLKCKVDVTEVFDESGNWITAKDPEIGDAHKKIFEKINKIDGVSYSPVATLAYRETSDGTQFRFFARKTIVTASPIDSYVILDVVEGSDAIVTYDVKSPVYEKGAPAGAYALCDSPKLDATELAGFNKAIDGLTGVQYTPVAKLATQVTGAEINYIIICESTTVTYPPVSGYSLVSATAKLDGTVTLGDIVSIEVPDSDRSGVISSNVWETPESPVVDNTLKAIVTKATAEFKDVTYTPIAWIGKKESDAGQDYKVFCRNTPNMTGGKTTYSVLDIRANLIGNAVVTEAMDTKIEGYGTDPAVGWAEAETPVIAKGEGELLNKALEGLEGVSYKALALLGTMKTRGTKYCFICEGTVVVPNAVPSYYLVEVSQDNDGKVTLGTITDLANA